MTEPFIRSAHAILIVFDGSSPPSADRLLRWAQIIHSSLLQKSSTSESLKSLPIVLIASKADLQASPDACESLCGLVIVSAASLYQLALSWRSVSNMTGAGVNELLEDITPRMVMYRVKAEVSRPKTFDASGNTILMRGWMIKRGQIVKNWKRRYFTALSDGIRLHLCLASFQRAVLSFPLMFRTSTYSTGRMEYYSSDT